MDRSPLGVGMHCVDQISEADTGREQYSEGKTFSPKCKTFDAECNNVPDI